MQPHMVICRVCKERFDINDLVEGEDYIQPVKRFYYHKKCYEDWKNSNPLVDEEWVDLIYDYISRDLKVKYNYYMCESQRKNFIEKNSYTNKGIFFTLKYFYGVKHNDWSKGNGGIGIVPYVYNEACGYWVDQERKNSGVCAQIEQQMQAARERSIKKIKKIQKPKAKRNKNSLELIANMEDDE